MFDIINGLNISISGRYNDAFLYENNLYLIDDEYLYIVDFCDLVISLIPDKNQEAKVLYKYAFLHNDFFYKSDNDFFDFFNMPKVKNFLIKEFSRFSKRKFNIKDIGKYIKKRIKHNHKGAYHLEIYKHKMFISSDIGVSTFTVSDDHVYHENTLLEFLAYNIYASYGNNVYFCCGDDGVNILRFEEINSKSAMNIAANKKIDVKALSLDFCYSDFVVKEIGNRYGYIADDKFGHGEEKRDYGPQENVDCYNYRETTIMDSAAFISVQGNKFIRGKDKSISIYKLNYEYRKNNIDDIDNTFELLYTFKCNYNGDIFDTFQTVFGLVVDTEKGTFVIDDDLDDSTSLNCYMISNGRNVKIRYFGRSINYSHILLNIKDESIDIYSDLTDYFFPKDKKKIRKGISRYKAMRG